MADAEYPPVLPPVRRVVAGNTADGLGTVLSDTLILSEASKAPGGEALRSGGLWTTANMPSKDTNDDTDGALRAIPGLGLVMRNGTNLRFTDLAPGKSAPMHRTSSIDYNILISGSLILVTDDGTERLVETPGDVIVQKGNSHAWRNPGPGWTRWVSVLVDAEPAIINGKALRDHWRGE